jgi:peptidoglycan/xylan/chitin deacetylase (PgdA/CDA1 family)
VPKRPGPDRRTFLVGAALALVAACEGSGRGSTPAPTGGERDGAGSPVTAPTAAGPAPVPTTAPSATAATAVTGFVVNGSRNRSRVALTFHTDGDLSLAGRLLDTLAARQVRMTSFVVGRWLDDNPTWARRIADAGHELANHTYTHPTFSALSRDAMLGEIVRCRDVLARLTGAAGRCFRPSGTADGTADPGPVVVDVAREAGYPVVLGFDVDPLDYTDPGPAAVTQRTLAGVRPGSVVSLHFGYAGTIAALPDILDGLARAGLAPVTVSELLSPS